MTQLQSFVLNVHFSKTNKADKRNIALACFIYTVCIGYGHVSELYTHC